ncbi:class I SAM-dependent methyltransferase [Mucilaginibacter aquaedulcis]|uniref:class I SAM-dependent methyltransferase n=1 Tax=Mucilaginibacter aquaedulcis TaxID=1187081 RepID=UPI0025B41FD3|nr:class I SAM-dependent methyltransferase [Mucilaginibacter aquaedulcis]MDN3549041.1 class I SAM-dependent methyltransferase [Mucilaginibacter aquaedulcis]
MSTDHTFPKDRDYSSISPSARSLLLLKGLTDIPFARQAAELIIYPEKYKPDFNLKNFVFWARVLHFENRYKSINQLLSGLPVKNILELSSGFSFRGLNTALNNDVYYIDTDLPEVIATKQNLLQLLMHNEAIPKGNLHTLPLNALDKAEFATITNHFPGGELAIVNEGLLVYLDTNEKKKLCHNIRNVLEKRGGYWITADIYIKSDKNLLSLTTNDKLQRFFEEHRIEENKFECFEAAEIFFKSEGFLIDKEAEPDYQSSGSLKHLRANASPEQLYKLGKTGRIRASWRLKLA